MHRTFNCGVGMALVVSREQAQNTIAMFEALDVQAFEIGQIVERKAGEPQTVVS
jgi:phosphoribosylformylglycinamidine cyclo-ligase